MEELFLLLQSDKTLRRVIKLLKYLSTHLNERITFHALSDALDCSRATLQHDINFIDQTFENIAIDVQKRDGVQLLNCSRMTIFDDISFLVKQSLPYKIIENIYQNRIFTLPCACTEFTVSESTLRRTIHHINQTIDVFHVKITTNDIDLVGKEEDIRVFLFNFYLSFNGYFATSTIHNEAILHYKDLLNIVRLGNTPNLHFSKLRTILWFKILEKRYRQNRFVEKRNELMDELAQYETFSLFRINAYPLKKMFDLRNLPIEELGFIYITLLHCISYAEPMRFMEKRVPYQYQRQESPEITQNICDFLAEVFPPSAFPKESLTLIQAFLVNLRLLSEWSSSFEQVSFPINDFAQKIAPTYYKKWVQLLAEKPPFQMIHIDHVAAILTLLQQDAVTRNPRKNVHKHIRVLFSFNGDPGLDSYMMNTSKEILNKHTEAIYVFEETLTNEKLEELAVDLIVCNYNLVLDDRTPVAYLPSIPSSTDWNELQEKLDKLTQKRATANKMLIDM